MQRRPILRFSPTLATLLVVLSAVPGLAQEADVREQFRSFYEPLLPQLKASYSNVSFRCVFITELQPEVQLKHATGQIQKNNFIFDRFPTIWLDSEERITQQLLDKKFDESAKPEKSGGWIDDFSFAVNYRSRGSELQVFHDEYFLDVEFEPCIIAPICSVKLRRTFESIMNDDSVRMIDFVDRRLRDGRKVKSLFYHPAGFPRDCVFEADFDPESGVSVSSQEIEKDNTDYPFIFSISYADSSPPQEADLLPPPLQVDGNFIMMNSMVVLAYDRVKESEQGEFSVARYGFDVSETERPVTLFDRVAGSANNILIVAGLVLLMLFLFSIFLVFIISFLAKRNVQRLRASERFAEKPADPPSDLSESG